MTARVIGLGAVSQVGVIVSGSRKRIGACGSAGYSWGY